MIESPFFYKNITSPIGNLKLVANDNSLYAVLFESSSKVKIAGDFAIEQDNNHPTLKNTEKQFNEYFSGNRKEFDLPLKMNGSVFQIKALKELQKIPYGQTISYAEQAKRMGDSKKARAAGMANSRNPIAIIVPCHRVIGASGDLTGFGGGLKTKKYLLDLEQQVSK